MQDNKDLLIEVQELVAQEQWAEAKKLLEEQHVQDISHVIGELDDDVKHRAFKMLDRPLWSEVFAYLEHKLQLSLLDELSQEEGRYILSNMAADDRTAFLERLPEEEMRNLLRLLPPRDVKQALRLLGYPEESVGRLMTPHFVSVRPDWTIAEAMEHIRGQSEEGETVNVIYVTDDGGQLLDMIELKRFILGKPRDTVERIMEDDVVSVTVTEDREEAVHKIQHYDIEALPVADDQGRLVGIVTVDDVLDVAEAESTEDFHKMGSVGVLNLNLNEASPWLLFRKRIGWLLILVFVNMFAGEIIGAYEEAIEGLFVLMTFLPLVVDSGGNAGTQSATLMVRALATGDVKMKDWLKLFGKELGVAAALGSAMAIAVFMVAYFWRADQVMDVSIVIALGMVGVVVVGSLVGMLLPFVLTRFNLDPATASAPLITSIADLAGIAMYFFIAATILGLTV
ncbi:magnesium transporter [Natronospira proteinivora]|uniref:Magnesium transporter MgtE n=1 Tax=Natronospira proteinivora TaxID=1807133 RepID=A0ABT1G812_9GAMM|nr:magnesium transporter [Natronospira proteinivora]MCP1727446.1 magnesium transporter [Natronospira proteinivora]